MDVIASCASTIFYATLLNNIQYRRAELAQAEKKLPQKLSYDLRDLTITQCDSTRPINLFVAIVIEMRANNILLTIIHNLPTLI